MSENGTREISLNVHAARLLAAEIVARNQAVARFDAVLAMTLAQAGEAGTFVGLAPKEDGTAVLVIAVNGNGG